MVQDGVRVGVWGGGGGGVCICEGSVLVIAHTRCG